MIYTIKYEGLNDELGNPIIKVYKGTSIDKQNLIVSGTGAAQSIPINVKRYVIRIMERVVNFNEHMFYDHGIKISEMKLDIHEYNVNIPTLIDCTVFHKVLDKYVKI